MRGLERPPRWGIAVLVVLVIGNIALLTHLFLRPAATDPYVPSSRASTVATPPVAPPADPRSTSDIPEEPAVLAVYGDGYTTGSAQGGQGSQGWPALVAEELGMEVRLGAASMAGYDSIGVTGETFPQLVAANPVPDADVVVVFGSRNDQGSSPASVEAAAAQTMASARAAAPGAQLLIIGPAWSNAAPPSDLAELSTAVQRAALAAGATYVDPLAEGWFSEPGTLIASDGISPTDAGHAYLAELIAPRVQAVASATEQPTA